MKDTLEQSIHEFYKQWFGSMEDQNIDSFLSLLADDFYLKSPASTATSDSTTLRTRLERYHQAYRSQVDWEIEDIQLFDKHAVVRVTESVTMINRQNRDTSKVSGVHLALLVKDGNFWKLKTDVSSLNRPISSSQ
jgi:ketosteroid isomerase-like protein